MSASGVLIRQLLLPHGERRYLFDDLQAGVYRVRAYYSQDGSGRYVSGTVQPWRPGVPTGEYAKEVTVRPRWEISKIDLEIR